jgi:hypothetical protein
LTARRICIIESITEWIDNEQVLLPRTPLSSCPELLPIQKNFKKGQDNKLKAQQESSAELNRFSLIKNYSHK